MISHIISDHFFKKQNVLEFLMELKTFLHQKDHAMQACTSVQSDQSLLCKNCTLIVTIFIFLSNIIPHITNGLFLIQNRTSPLLKFLQGQGQI